MELRKTSEVANEEFKKMVLSFIREHSDKDRSPSFRDARKRLEEDKRWEAVPNSADREKLFQIVAREHEESRRKRIKRLKQDEAEVDSLRKKRRTSEATEILHSLFAERVKIPYTLTWKEAKETVGDCSQLRKVDLRAEEIEKIWEEYKKSAISARHEAFALLLASKSSDVIGPSMAFEDILENTLMSDAAAEKVFDGVPLSVLRSAWEEWRGKAHELALETCRKWLASCEYFRGFEDVTPSKPDFERLIQKLKEDRRFRRLNHAPAEQRHLVTERLEELRELRKKGRSAMEVDDGDKAET